MSATGIDRGVVSSPRPIHTSSRDHLRVLDVEPSFCGYCGQFLFFQEQAPVRMACPGCGATWQRDAALRWHEIRRTAR